MKRGQRLKSWVYTLDMLIYANGMGVRRDGRIKSKTI